MQVKTQGLIIREQTVGESDRLVTVLTRDAGVVRAFARRAKNLKDSKSAATQLLCYSRLSIFKGREKYMIDDAEPIEVFFGLRRDIAALSLAQYFLRRSKRAAFGYTLRIWTARIGAKPISPARQRLLSAPKASACPDL